MEASECIFDVHGRYKHSRLLQGSHVPYSLIMSLGTHTCDRYHYGGDNHVLRSMTSKDDALALYKAQSVVRPLQTIPPIFSYVLIRICTRGFDR